MGAEKVTSDDEQRVIPLIKIVWSTSFLQLFCAEEHKRVIRKLIRGEGVFCFVSDKQR